MKNSIKLLTILAALSLVVTSCGGKGKNSQSSFNSSSESSEKDSSKEPSLPPSSSSLPLSSSSLAPKTYTITWKNADGKVLETDFDVIEGTLPTYDGAAPIKDPSAQYNYVWTGWTPNVIPATANTEYVATYKEELRKYTVIWKDEDGKVLETDNNVPYGSTPTYNSAEPVKESTAQYSYQFKNWSPAISEVVGDTEYVATYQETLRKYTVTWKNEDGTILASEEFDYGSSPEYKGNEPTKASTERYQYRFDGWTPNVTNVTKDVEYTATYKEENRLYTIKWVNYDGTVLETDSLEYLAVPTYNGDTPTRVNDRAVAYTWNGWTPEITPVQSDKVYTATYNGVGFFSYDLINYETEEGYSLSDLRGAPWINYNLDTETNKIKKPSLKDDFYTAINYDNIKNNVRGPFEIGDDRVSDAFKKIYNNSEETRNGDFLYSVYNQLSEGDVDNAKEYFANFDVDQYLNSKESLLAPSSYIKLIHRTDGFELNFNDGYIYGNTGIHTLLFFSIFSNYEFVFEPTLNIINQLGEAFDFSTDEIEDSITVIRNLSSRCYNASFDYGTDDTVAYRVRSLPWEPVKNAMLDVGFSEFKKIYVKKYIVNSLNTLYNDYYVNYKEEVKKSILIRLAFDYRFLLGLDSYRNINGEISKVSNLGLFPQEVNIYGESDRSLAKKMLRLLAPEIFEQTYLELEGNADIKQRVTTIIEDVLDGYKELVTDIDWLSSSTKKNVLRKLSKMTHESCYSDVAKDYEKIDDTDLENASLLNLFGRYYNTVFDHNYVKREPDPFAWVWNRYPSYTVNAFYAVYQNSFVIINGLSRGFVGVDDSVEEVYGKLGFVIGHEITHAFDANGSRFDEKGQENDLMSTEDRKTFDEKVQKLDNFYNSIYLYENMPVVGTRIHSEAIADMGGIKVMLQLAKRIPNFDYDLFFRASAKTWCFQPYDQWGAEYRANVDSHPYAYLRVNVTLPQFDEFIETYDLAPGDGMYIPKEQRVTVW